jgi:hypothetical protein
MNIGDQRKTPRNPDVVVSWLKMAASGETKFHHEKHEEHEGDWGIFFAPCRGRVMAG